MQSGAAKRGVAGWFASEPDSGWLDMGRRCYDPTDHTTGVTYGTRRRRELVRDEMQGSAMTVARVVRRAANGHRDV
jgi:hypothetical protein